MFCDHTKLILTAGNGGKGVVAFRREKFVERGGPSGGDGGKGGNIFIKVNTALNSLIHLHTYKRFNAEHGEQGHGQNKHGADAEDLILEVPLGTIIKEIIRDEEDEIIERRIITDLSSEFKSVKIVKGGRGGYGNAHFVSSIRQAPKFAEIGEEGESIEVELELKLVADIGIIGIPSSGKSTLISVLSNAKPKIAEYHFTTLTPHLGVAKIGEDKSYIIADIPGLIQGAHRGKGLGIAFLKHIQRCRFLVHLIDPLQSDLSEDADHSQDKVTAALKNFTLINEELEKFSEELTHKKQIVVLNKSDVISDEEKEEYLKGIQKAIKGDKRFAMYPEAISSATTDGIKEFKNWLYRRLEEMKDAEPQVHFPEPEEENSEEGEKKKKMKKHILYTPHLDDPKYHAIEKIEDGIYHVTGQRITQIVNMSDFNNREAVLRVRDVLKKMGIDKELKKIGLKDGDTVRIGKHELEFNSDPF